MCGIFGVVNFTGMLQYTEDSIRTACNKIVHRGPDESGYYSEPGVALCHRRLSIIDISGGKQPMSTEDGRYTLTYNGEIYNYEIVRNTLVSKGYNFTTNSDTEVVLKAFAEYGYKCLSLFNGMFAVAIWDKQERSLLIARDRMGKKPLYYTIVDDTVIFSSELKSIYILYHNKSIDYQALQDYFTFGYIPTPRTIYNNIFKLEPASYAIITNEGLTKTSYWDVDFTTDDSISYTDAKQRVEDLLDKAVERRLVSDVPFGAFLSGGIDSSVVVSMMQRHLSTPVKTFSIGFDVARYNELDDARKISKHIGTDHTEFVLESNCTDIVHEFTKYYDEPFGDSSSLPTYFVSKLAKDHVKMVLTGDGGDEIFGGYKRYSRHLINDMASRLIPYPGTVSSLLRAVPSTKFRKISDALTRASSEYPHNYLQEVALSTSSVVHNIINRSIVDYDSYDSMAPLFTSQGNGLNRIYYGDIKSYMLDDILVKVDRMSMANSIEVRSPFLDVDLVEYSSRLPVNYKTSLRKGKLLLRDIASKYVPDDIVNNKKKGFAIPLKEWFNKELKHLLIDLISSNRSNKILNYNYIDSLINEHSKGMKDNSEILWLVLCFEIWCKEYHNA